MSAILKNKIKHTQEVDLKYKNETDRCYGLAGMIIALAALDALDRVSSLSLDNSDDMICFSQEYYFGGSPSISAKTTWNHILENYQLTSAMTIANMLSRKLVGEHKPIDKPLLDTIYLHIAAEGQESCSLDDDEIRALFDKTLSYSNRIFSNSGIYPKIQQFVQIISERRTLTNSEICDLLHSLRMI